MTKKAIVCFQQGIKLRVPVKRWMHLFLVKIHILWLYIFRDPPFFRSLSGSHLSMNPFCLADLQLLGRLGQKKQPMTRSISERNINYKLWTKTMLSKKLLCCFTKWATRSEFLRSVHRDKLDFRDPPPMSRIHIF